MSAVAPIIAAQAAKRRKLIRHFRANGALAPETAIARNTLPWFGFRTLERLQAIGAVRSAPDGKLYLDEKRLLEAGQQQQRAAAIALMALVAAVLVAILVIAAVHAFEAH